MLRPVQQSLHQKQIYPPNSATHHCRIPVTRRITFPIRFPGIIRRPAIATHTLGTVFESHVCEPLTKPSAQHRRHQAVFLEKVLECPIPVILVAALIIRYRGTRFPGRCRVQAQTVGTAAL
jgi:hypothetical protein